MTFTTERNGDSLVVRVEGRLDTQTAPELEEALASELEGVTDLTFDLSDLEYISSSGLRLLLVEQKRMYQQGSMHVCNVNEVVAEVFEATGFDDILDIS